MQLCLIRSPCCRHEEEVEALRLEVAALQANENDLLERSGACVIEMFSFLWCCFVYM